ncbi:hypothetical protein HanPSC8_Chr03g0104581 [Helianthus annuus]|nr:hypothetical protein HanPSC8_Chr03g0104581 [Helianthus annuus]
MIYTYRPVFIHITTHSRIKEQVREQVSTSVQQRDELDSRINVIFYHLFVWTCDCLSLIEVECSMYTYV